ncbi:GntR family transcriptional regulator [Sporomusa acidovorans]|uniref:HTH-type transcriptional repressor YtrA n=1 Tax=Sporomusa acidovorans (strain ATCC 49682 / DSM 3132 / Mol) TaxID=1123286 RepID=A0ABZ3J5K0_SPOA4|nr:GntR family transcriptional regulator [Sporomusa acidovorans]OZC24267.1 HTH-type transcriptional repressor YtrA [Sporomusa acidovorans DSM 3132]SDF03553.1 transcriptional regulator, GntR family [Sporomusa acidovorans]
MLPAIDPKSGVPLYIQLQEEIKALIVKGAYPPGEQLPTVRQLAVDLRINSNTVARAYSELEREGIISTHQGRGTFVCGLPEIVKSEVKEQQLDGLLERLLADAYVLGYQAQEVLSRLEQKIKRISE